MTQCEDCSRLFHFMDSGLPKCPKCTKLNNAAPGDRKIIMDHPQCKGCGVTYTNLGSDMICGSCEQQLLQMDPKEREDISSASLSLQQFLAEKMASYTHLNTGLRLNQPRPQPASLVKSRAENIKAKVTMLKKQSRTEQVLFLAEVWAPKMLGQETGKKSSLVSQKITGLSSPHKSCITSEAIDHVLEQLVEEVQNVMTSSGIHIGNLDFNMRAVNFSVKPKGGSVYCHLDDRQLSGTVADFISFLKNTSMLPSTYRETSKTITLRTMLRLLPELLDDHDVNNETSDVDDESSGDKGDDPGVKPVKRKRGASIASPSAPAGQRTGAVKSSKVTLAPSARLRLVAASAAPALSAVRYQSSFRPMRTAVATTVRYKTVAIQCILFAADMTGLVGERVIPPPDGQPSWTIDLAEGWQAEIGKGSMRGGYISSGLSKYAFRGILKGESLAIFQNKPSSVDGTLSKGDNERNHGDARDEASLIAVAQFLLNSFYKRANAHGANPSAWPNRIRWNPVWVGLISKDDMAQEQGVANSKERAFLWDAFIAAPLLDLPLESVNNHREVKFAGNSDYDPNTTVIGRIIDAYIHHSVVDTQGMILLADVQGLILPDGDLVLFDPQAHSGSLDSDYRLGFWDKGPKQIEEYFKVHRCNSICRQLSLDREPKMVNGKNIDSRMAISTILQTL